MDTLQVLKEARALIAEESSWAQGDLARTIRDEPIKDLQDPLTRLLATQWCSIGALQQADDGSSYEEGAVAEAITALLSALEVRQGTGPRANAGLLAHYNDRILSHKEVTAMFDRAIATLEKDLPPAGEVLETASAEVVNV